MLQFATVYIQQITKETNCHHKQKRILKQRRKTMDKKMDKRTACHSWQTLTRQSMIAKIALLISKVGCVGIRATRNGT